MLSALRLRHRQNRQPENLRVLFCVTGYFPAPVGGTERQARLQAIELTRRGHKVVVVCPHDASTVQSGAGDGIRVIRLRRLPRRPFRTLSYLVRLLLFLLRHARDYDLVHIHLANLQADVGVLAVRLAKRPSFVKVACGGVQSEMQRLRRVAGVTRWYGLRHATLVQALSPEIEDELRQIGVSQERIVRIPNGVDLKSFRPPLAAERAEARRALGLPSEAPIVLFLGRFAVYKGIADLLEAWSRVSWLGNLVLVGTADTHGGMETIPAFDGIEVRPWTNAPLEYLKASDVFVHPTHADGMSNALLEAMACGVAPIATRHGATERMLTDGEDALLVSPHDPDALAEALCRLLSDPARRAEIAANAAETAYRYSISSVTDQIEAMYREITREPQASLSAA
jgi:glycosyltransferase involved in cell wall biosynthesis